MGNNSSTAAAASKKSTSKKQSFFCCPCLISKSSSSSSLSIDEKYFPTFDRIKPDEKIYRSPPLFKEIIPSTSHITQDDAEKTLLSSYNRRSVSLHNVVSVSPDVPDGNQGQQPIHSKPPLPPGKSVTVSKLPPIGRSFRVTLGDTKRTYYSQSIQHARLSIEDLEKSLHGSSSIDQWIDSLPIVGTPSLNRNKSTHANRTVVSTNNKKIKRSLTTGDEYDDTNLNGSYRQEDESTKLLETTSPKTDFPHILTLKHNREYLALVKNFRLNIYLKDFLTRLNNPSVKQTFKNHFSIATVIYPFPGIDQTLADSLNLFLITPSESILPNLSSNTHSSYRTYEQIRSKCYFIPTSDYKIEADDDEYKKKRIELDRTHVFITIENKTTEHDDTTKSKKVPIEPESLYIFTSDDSFHTGFIRIDEDKIPKHILPYIFHSSEDNIYYVSSNLIQQWFNTLILVNQTCAIAKRFLTGDGSHITCLIKQQTNHTSSFSLENNLTFAALRLPPCMSLSDSLQTNLEEEKSNITDAFSSTFLSDNKKTFADTVHIDYEQYSFAFLLYRWPKLLLDNYFTQSIRDSKRKWPSKYHLNIIIKKPLILVPIQNDHKWKISFDLIEQSLFELMNESTLYFYALCQQLFSQTATTRTCVKHCFLNYCEKYGLPFSSNREHTTDNIHDLMSHFLREIHVQINEKFIPNYFNHEINLYETNTNYNQWYDYINKCLKDSTYISLSSSLTISNRPIIVEFLFHFIDQLYQTFHIKRSQFHLNENVLVDLHKQLCEKLSNDTNNNSTLLHEFINHLLNNQQLLEHIQSNLTYDFETNAELVHTCLNQVRKAESSLIFHYTWTIYVQYLHTYYNVLWNI
ncbi:unnamed protein product [Adineta steineri]|uniref:Uncharacterized protein n=1 Tax=Adineta steineri TaxID=433720 RepID=A0A815KXW5_9BILA|nr:unnamed protein product [Adineta steineri]CAF1613831.1 unnamed protein product [Adineta steineri]